MHLTVAEYISLAKKQILEELLSYLFRSLGEREYCPKELITLNLLRI